jgi:hypothetical protein
VLSHPSLTAGASPRRRQATTAAPDGMELAVRRLCQYSSKRSPSAGATKHEGRPPPPGRIGRRFSRIRASEYGPVLATPANSTCRPTRTYRPYCASWSGVPWRRRRRSRVAANRLHPIGLACVLPRKSDVSTLVDTAGQHWSRSCFPAWCLAACRRRSPRWSRSSGAA